MLMLGAGPSQSTPPAAGLTAEAESRWTEALQIYREQVLQDQATPRSGRGLPKSRQSWANRSGRSGRSNGRRQRRRRTRQRSPGSSAGLCGPRGHALAAFRAIEGALALDTGSDSFVRAHATLATWAGQDAAAADSYRRLSRRTTEIHLTLALARVNAWRGASDQAVVAYREYVDAPGSLTP